MNEEQKFIDYLNDIVGIEIMLEPYKIKLKVSVDEDLQSLGQVSGIREAREIYFIVKGALLNFEYIVHECMHVLDEVEAIICDKLTNEARAYFMEYVFSEVCKALKEFEDDNT